MKFRILFLLLFLIFFFQACTRHVKINNEYYKNAKLYFETEFGVDVIYMESSYIVLPLQGCKSCLIDCLSYLSDSHDKQKYTVVLVGTESYFFEDEITTLLTTIKKEYKCLTDRKQKIYRYRTGFSHPLKMSFSKDNPEYLEFRYKNGKPSWYEVL